VDFFSAETLQARREWHDLFKVLRGKKMAAKNPVSNRLSFRIEEEIEFPRQTKVKGVHHH